jgi:glucokinase
MVIGIDLGGTMVRAGAFGEDGRLQQMRQTPIEARRGPQVGLERIGGLIAEVLAEIPESSSLKGIGVGATGPVDALRGTVNNPYTLPTWEDVPITGYLRERFGVPVTLENDADVAALGEYWCGAGQGVGRLYAITVGTGIGTALIMDGEIYRGLDGTHPDGGHQVIDPSGPECYCGAHGCWESLASGSAIARMAQEVALSQGRKGEALLRLAGGEASRITAKLAAQAALQGDALAGEVMRRAAEAFALGVVNVVTLFTPEMIVLSGGVMQSAELFMPALKRAMQRHNVMVPATKVRIVEAQLGEYAGLYGAAFTIARNERNYGT